MTGESTLALIGALLALAALFIPSGIAIMRVAYKAIPSKQTKKKAFGKERATEDKQAVA